ncbi:hypothetical protein JVU11DRAFT_7756 [Chiua virens]|nr:hypothetical protein JVU11DRAFT_7756 [Chiua virens]
MHSRLPQAHVQHVNEGALSARAFVNEEDRRPTGHSCVICLDPIQGTEIRALCGHYYDIDCTTSLFQAATRDETLYPPRCCGQNIPLSHVQSHLPEDTRYALSSETSRIFYPQACLLCSPLRAAGFWDPYPKVHSPKPYTFVLHQSAEHGRAPSVVRNTLVTGHTSASPETDAAQILAFGRAAGWARCPGCSHMIELHAGCFHVTCRCRTEFCYLCGARWKTCRCPQWDERRPVVAAEERVDAQVLEGRVGQDVGARWNGPAQQECPVLVPVPAPVQERIPIENSHSPPGARLAPIRVPDPGIAWRPAPALPIAIRPMQLRVNDTMRQSMVFETADRRRVDLDRHHALWHYRNGWHSTCWRCRHW